MKQLYLLLGLMLQFILLIAQDFITLKTGEIINAKVSEVGINEIRYYKTTNLTGPVYVTSKGDVAQITYANGTTDIINVNTTNATTGNVSAGSPTQTVLNRKPVRRSRSYFRLPLFIPHIDLGRHIDFGHHSYSHHRRHH